MYSPRIRDDQVKALYQLKLLTNRPMTHLIQEAVDDYLLKNSKSSPPNKNQKKECQ